MTRPIVLHGGTGLSNGTFKKLIAAGCAKVNVFAMLKITFADSFKSYRTSEGREISAIATATVALCQGHSPLTPNTRIRILEPR